MIGITLLFMAQSLLCLFLCFFCYTLGVRHGRITVNGGVPHVPNPVTAIQKAADAAVEQKKAGEAQAELDEILDVSKESMLKVIGRERGKRMGKV
jgi:hypothetical protein